MLPFWHKIISSLATQFPLLFCTLIDMERQMDQVRLKRSIRRRICQNIPVVAELIFLIYIDIYQDVRYTS